MKVTLIDYTGCGHNDPDYAVNILLFTKNTRLNMTPNLMEEIANWPPEKKMTELKYMANTIPSSWEFLHYTFLIEGVTRAFTHQFVRSRNLSFAQQTMRVLEMKDWDYLVGPTIAANSARELAYRKTMKEIDKCYQYLIHGEDASIEDARGVLPTNILTNIVACANMRSFVELVRKRSSSRTQGEYRDVLEGMKAQVREVHPWIDMFIERTFERAASDLDKEIRSLNIPQEKKMHMIKLTDQMRGQS